MCGILAGVKKEGNLLELKCSLKKLEYRGNDSCGIVLFLKDQIKEYKVVGSCDELFKKINETELFTSYLGHTRWATHGKPSLNNTHPVHSNNKNIYLVHNGVIENYKEIKDILIDNGYHFLGDTDSEIAANYIDFLINVEKLDTLDALLFFTKNVTGSYAIAFKIVTDEKLYFIKKDSPLFVGKGANGNVITSDPISFDDDIKSYLALDDNNYGYIAVNDILIFDQDKKSDLSFKPFKKTDIDVNLDGYSSYMLKEIEETKQVVSRLYENYFKNGLFSFDADLINAMKEADEFIFLGCGSSYHACLYAKNLFINSKVPASAYVASEFSYNPIFTSKKPLFFLVSQSGETADLIKCQKIIANLKLPYCAITNRIDCSLNHHATYSLNLEALQEIAVVSTKTFSSQIILLYLLKCAYIGDVKSVVSKIYIDNTLENITAQKYIIDNVSKELLNSSYICFIGKGNGYIASKEAALKMKEISYIPSEAYPSGELKHGPIALIDDNSYVFAFVDSTRSMSIINSNSIEAETRGSKIYLVSAIANKNQTNQFSFNDLGEELNILPLVYFSQYLSYYVAKEKGLNIDKPRNLAKAITVQ